MALVDVGVSVCIDVGCYDLLHGHDQALGEARHSLQVSHGERCRVVLSGSWAAWYLGPFG